MKHQQAIDGEKEETFVVRVRSCQENEWHGDVVWASGSGTQKFESMQELFMLINESFQTDEQQKKAI